MPNQPLHVTAAAVRFSGFNVSPAAAKVGLFVERHRFNCATPEV
jgi:hypothetical protein